MNWKWFAIGVLVGVAAIPVGNFVKAKIDEQRRPS